MRQFYPIVFLCVAAYGVYYFAAHKKILSRKFFDSEIPEGAERTAKYISIAMVVIGVLGVMLSWLGVF